MYLIGQCCLQTMTLITTHTNIIHMFWSPLNGQHRGTLQWQPLWLDITHQALKCPQTKQASQGNSDGQTRPNKGFLTDKPGQTREFWQTNQAKHGISDRQTRPNKGFLTDKPGQPREFWQTNQANQGISDRQTRPNKRFWQNKTIPWSFHLGWMSDSHIDQGWMPDSPHRSRLDVRFLI